MHRNAATPLLAIIYGTPAARLHSWSLRAERREIGKADISKHDVNPTAFSAWPARCDVNGTLAGILAKGNATDRVPLEAANVEKLRLDVGGQVVLFLVGWGTGLPR